MGGMTALLYAAREGHMETLKALVEGKADVNLVSGGDKFSPMVTAITNGHLTIAKYLLDHGADIRMIQKMLGHVSVGTTQAYTFVSMKQVQKVLDKCHPRNL